MGTSNDQSDHESVLLDFETAWKIGEPDLHQFVHQQRDLKPDTLMTLAERDLTHRWDTGSRLEAENYLRHFPQLAEVDDGIGRLIRAEQTSRRKHGCEIPDSEYESRFPGSFVATPLPIDSPDDPVALPETIARLGSTSDQRLESDPATDVTIIPNHQNRVDSDAPLPQTIGRYTVREVVGRGGGGTVYRAFDEHLGRDVAIKVPHIKVLGENADLAREYRHEARVVAQLDHDHITRIYDVNSTDTLPCYLVTQFISGQTLSARMRNGGLTEDESVELVVSMADALQHAHSHGVVHRDVKPGNILVDDSGKPWLADFGLALDDISLARRGEVAGTPSYMSPEQAGGEGHRIDGRSDIFSLGIVLYELLTRKRPFRGDTTHHVMRDICERDAPPLRQLDSSIPKELERICLKSLARQISDRYATAADFAEDLKLWQNSRQLTSGDDADQTPELDSSNVDTFVVPKGLRSFDEQDANFFLSLLPGARGRDGLPESVRFWKSRVEQTDSDATFSVGIVYGPSGCGKSSLIRAGVIPRLDDAVTAVYVEATPEDTESRILRAVTAAVGSGSENQSLVELFQTIRRQGRKKVVLFVDQFEQWLQTHRDPDSELVRALRQCDGTKLQAVVMVRDDFWLAASRFMRELDVRIKEGDNSNLVDLFPLSHAERVLTLFAQARGDLPQAESEISDDNQAFVRDAVQSLAQEDKVVCIRLALFAEIMRGKQWLPATLETLGGTSGIGLTFLEETFSSPSAPIEHRVHQAAARNVLRSLLPVAGTQLKGHMVSVEQLRKDSGYESLPGEFDDLLLVLDQQLRLITPTDPLGQRIQEGSSTADAELEHGVCYQLTHDYLVPTLREWLYLKQRETRRGRAELLLSERASLWADRQNRRQFLPSLLEWMSIRLWTKKKRWTDAERAMVRVSDRRHLSRFVVVTTIVLLMAAGLVHILSSHQETIAKQQEKNDREETETLVTIMLGAPGFAFPYTRELVRPFQDYALDDVHRRLREGALPAVQELHARLFLADSGELDSDFIVQAIRDCDASECANIVKALSSESEYALTQIQMAFREAVDRKDIRTATRLAIVALCFGDIQLAGELASDLPCPWPRTLLIETLSEWNCELAKLAKTLESVEQPHLRSALCLGIGGISRPGGAARTEWSRVWQKWYVEHPDAGTHSASRWALQSWKTGVPDVATGESKQRDWYHTDTGLVLLRIPAGNFSRFDANAREGRRHQVTFARDFWVSDREVSIGQYRNFLQQSGDLVGWTDRNSSLEYQFPGADPRWPMQNVTWFEAVVFCNWLSEQEGLEPAYLLTDRFERSQGIEFKVENQTEANGYRLPTEAEWEYFTRAGTSSAYSTGDHRSPLADYANVGSVSPMVCGTLRCNPWGLFDTHGNVIEWCQDKRGQYSDANVTNPQGATDAESYSYRGGGWFHGRRDCRSEYRDFGKPLVKRYTLGFRVVRNAG